MCEGLLEVGFGVLVVLGILTVGVLLEHFLLYVVYVIYVAYI